MAGSGSESFTSRSVNYELVPRGLKEEMFVRLALRRSPKANARRQRSNSQPRESIASAQPVLGSGVAASSEAVQSVWCPNAVAEAQSLHWRAEHEAWPTSDDVMAWRACRARQRSHDDGEALAVADVGEAESHSLAPRRVQQRARRTHVVVDFSSSQKGSVIDLTSTGIVRVTGSDEEE
ncbi:atp-dependent dna helicase q4 [Hordeum vulgare]|nr:atp-dependent dna helicase q4 [Hordeum vulgare]